MPRLFIPETFDYSDVRLVPRKCVVGSRSEVDTNADLGYFSFKLPVVPANMSTIIDEKLAEWLASNGYFYVMHRFDIDAVDFTKKFQEKNLITSISLGIKQVDFDTIQRFVDEGISPDYITVDVAHGHSENVMHIVRTINEKLPKSFVIAGNVGTAEGALDLIHSGASAVKVGIGPGCFVPGTKVLTENGLKSIENIEIGDKVLSHLGTFEKVANKFEYAHHEETININGIECTVEHEFYVCDKKDMRNINENNYQEYCYWVEAHALNEKTQMIIEIEK